MLYDAHVHLDFMSNGEEIAAAAQAAGMRLFAGTVTPAGYRAARGRFAGFSSVDLGLGLHPWWVKRSADADELIALLPETRFVNEVGLDFGKRQADTVQEQAEAFGRIAVACAEQGGKALSIHAVKAARETLDILEQAGTLESCTCVFHWFSGPSDQLKRAIDAGCLFSVNKRMLATGKGREYVKAIPAGQLLTETDAPPEQDKPYSFDTLRDELEHVAEAILHIKGEYAAGRIA